VRAIKAAPSELKPQADRNDPRVLKPFAKTPYTPTTRIARRQRRKWDRCRNRSRAAGALAGRLRADAWRSEEVAAAPFQPEYSFPRTANAPITVNQLVSSFTPWSPEDQYQMSKWNHYGNIFRISTSPTGNWAWTNNRFDLCGFPSSADMQSQFGSGWDPNTSASATRAGTPAT
jgi:hypothetical protein